MALSFTDTNGEEGTVQYNLEIDYSGEWQQEITNCITQIADEQVAERRLYSALVAELPDRAPVIAIEQYPRPNASQDSSSSE